MNSWEDWCKRIIGFSKAESATCPFLKKLLLEFDKADEFACLEGMYI